MKVFISYHRADLKQMVKLRTVLEDSGHIVVALENVPEFEGEYHEYIKNTIIQDLKSCDVIVCLVGKLTYSRPHVDHEINVSLSGGVGIRKGIVALMIENRDDSITEINLDTFPTRLQNNKKYICLSSFCTINTNIDKKLKLAVKNAKDATIKVDNTLNVMELKQKQYKN